MDGRHGAGQRVSGDTEYILPHQNSAFRPPRPPPKPQTYSLRLERIRKLSDEELMQFLTRESVPDDEVLDDGVKMAINAELTRRQAAKFERPKWWQDRNYWVALVAAVGGVIAAVPVVWGWLR